MTTMKKIERITAKGFDGREHTADYRVVVERNVFGDRVVVLEPIDGEGSFATSNVERENYQYRNGGNLYRAAVDRARKILASL